MRSDHLRSTDRGIRQVSRLPQTSEATAEADAEPQIQIGAGRQGPSEPCRLLTKASQNCTRVLALKSHGQSLEEPFRLSCNTFIGSGRDGCSQLLPGLGGNGPPATGAVAKIEALQLCKWTECGGAGSSCPRRPRQHGYHRLWLLQLVLSEATGHSQVKGRRAEHSPGRHPRHQLGGDCCVHGMSHPPVPHAQYCMNLVNPTIFPMTYSFWYG